MSWRTSVREAAAHRLGPLTERQLRREAIRLLQAEGTDAADAVADELLKRAAESEPTPSAFDLLRRWLNALDDVERERVERDTRRLLADHAAGRL